MNKLRNAQVYFLWNTMQIISIEGIETPSENKISNQKLVHSTTDHHYQ